MPAYVHGLGGPRWTPGAVPAVGSIIRSISASASHTAAGGSTGAPPPQRPTSGTFNQVYLFREETCSVGNGGSSSGTALLSQGSSQIAVPPSSPSAAALGDLAAPNKQRDSTLEATTALVHAIAIRSPPLASLSSHLEAPDIACQLAAASSSASNRGSTRSRGNRIDSSSGTAQPLLRPGPVWLRGSAVARTGGLQALRLEVELLPGGGMRGRLGREAVAGPQHVAATLPVLEPAALSGGGWTADGRVFFKRGHGLAELV